MPTTKKSNKQWILSSLISIIVVSCIFLAYINLSNTSSGTKQYEGKGFSSAKEASKAYVKALNDGDYAQMVSTLAVESYIEHYDMKAYMNRLMCYTPTNKISFLDQDAFSHDMLIQSRMSELQSLLNYQYYKISGISQNFEDNGYDMMTTIRLESDSDVNNFVKQIYKNVNDPADMKIQMNGFLDASDLGLTIDISDKKQQFLSKMQKVYGADSVEDLILSISIDGEDYYLFTECVEYNGKWYIQGFNSFYSNCFGLSYNDGGLIRQDEL